MKPFYDRNGITIYCGDCLEVMPFLTSPFDSIIADWPYGTTACSWDSVVDLDKMWPECNRVIKRDGATVLMGSQPFTTTLINSNIDRFKYEWIWEKNRGSNFANTSSRPMKEHENILVFSNGTCVYNPQLEKRSINGASRAAYTINPSNTGKREVYSGIKADKPRSINKDLRVPRSVQKFNTEVGLHPTQKPVTLFQYLIQTYTNPGELVLDNTMGSGTTLVAAQNTGRQAVGIELSEDYCKIAVERLRQQSFYSITRPHNNQNQAELLSSDESKATSKQTDFFNKATG